MLTNGMYLPPTYTVYAHIDYDTYASGVVVLCKSYFGTSGKILIRRKEMDFFDSVRGNLPNHWRSESYRNKNYIRVELEEESEEYKEVLEYCNGAGIRNVKKIDRIQHPFAYLRFQLKQEFLQSHLFRQKEADGNRRHTSVPQNVLDDYIKYNCDERRKSEAPFSNKHNFFVIRREVDLHPTRDTNWYPEYLVEVAEMDFFDSVRKNLPNHWQWETYTAKNYIRVELEKESKEYEEVMVYCTVEGIRNVKKIERIQHPFAYLRFQLKQEFQQSHPFTQKEAEGYRRYTTVPSEVLDEYIRYNCDERRLSDCSSNKKNFVVIRREVFMRPTRDTNWYPEYLVETATTMEELFSLVNLAD